MTFFLIAVLSGVLTVLAPCILPLLPVVVGSGEPGVRHLSRRAITVILSLSVSVVLFTLLLKASTLLISIPSTFWTGFSGTVMVLLGLSLLFPLLWAQLPVVGQIARAGNQAVGNGYKRQNVIGDVIMGAALGPVFSTCSPTYLFIVATVLPASFLVGLLYLGGFVLGLMLVLLLIAYFGQQLITVLLKKLTTASGVKKFLGVLFVLLGVAIIFGWDKQLESKILDSGYGATIQFEEGLLERFTPPGVRQENSPAAEGGEETVLESATAPSSEPVVATTSNSTEVVKEATAAVVPVEAGATGIRTAVFGNGCFWCVEHDLAKVDGVIDVVSGYAGGTTENPDYKNYDEGGHREVVLVTYEASQVSYGNLVEHIIKHGDPTDANGSFKDRGAEYAPAIYYETPEEAATARAVIAAVDGAGVFSAPLPLPVLPRVTFYPAEEYHQDYSDKNPLKYGYYRAASGRTAFITSTWGDDLNRFTYSRIAPTTESANAAVAQFAVSSWQGYRLPSEQALRAQLSTQSYAVTREDDTERAGTSPLDKNYEPGIYVDIISGEPVYSSKDKFDSGTGWPSFVKPITEDAVTLHEDNTLFSKRTEVRSRYSDSHLGHVFDDGPDDRGGKRYCMNGAALRFIAKADMKAAGYEYWLQYVE
jgi:peptide methionine sulfoxide reductase msrA/msrB